MSKVLISARLRYAIRILLSWLPFLFLRTDVRKSLLCMHASNQAISSQCNWKISFCYVENTQNWCISRQSLVIIFTVNLLQLITVLMYVQWSKLVYKLICHVILKGFRNFTLHRSSKSVSIQNVFLNWLGSESILTPVLQHLPWTRKSKNKWVA